jgi:separase
LVLLQRNAQPSFFGCCSYFGHSAGEKYIQQHQVQQLEKGPGVALLMGCSSGALHEFGDFESNGMPLSYLVSGWCVLSLSLSLFFFLLFSWTDGCASTCSAACVGNLWDVTDGDIDRFSESLLKNWTGDKSLLHVISEARKACKMRYLVGASPVYYGVPVFLKSRRKEVVKETRKVSSRSKAKPQRKK